MSHAVFADALPLPPHEFECDDGIDDMLQELFPEALKDNAACFHAAVSTSSGDSAAGVVHVPREAAVGPPAQKQSHDPIKAARLERKRVLQRASRQRERQQREEAQAKISELQNAMARLHIENSRLRIKEQAMKNFCHYLDNLIAGMTGGETDLALDHPLCGKLAEASTALTMTILEFRQAWQMVASKGAEALMQSHAGNAVGDEMIEVCSPQVEQWRFNLAVLRPEMLEEIMQMNMDTGEAEHPPPTHWHKVVRHVNLTPDQAARLMEEGEILGASGQIEQGLNRMVQEISSLTGEGTQQLQHLHAVMAGSEERAGLPRAFCAYSPDSRGTVMASLERMLKQQTILQNLLCAYAARTFLTPKQRTAMVVGAYPYVMHMTYFLEAVKQLHGHQQA